MSCHSDRARTFSIGEFASPRGGVKPPPLRHYPLRADHEANQKAKGKGQRAKMQQPPFSNFDFPITIFQFPITIFDFRISIFAFRFSQALVPPRNEDSAHNLLWNQGREIQVGDILTVFGKKTNWQLKIIGSI
jgi:hypothetical protein